MTSTNDYRRPAPGTHPKPLTPAYASTVKRAPQRPLVAIPQTVSEITGPLFGPDDVKSNEFDLTKQCAGDPIGERIIVAGKVVDENGRPVPNTLVEMWQANSTGRYRHKSDQHDAPLDPNFIGVGRALSDATGAYRFITIKPGCYPWRNHPNAWRPAHLHFSLFGPNFLTRIVTQMYFPGDPLLPFDPIYNSVPDEKARRRLISEFDWETTTPEWALGFRFDIVLRGRDATPMER